jgi:hypothetical protein
MKNLRFNIWPDYAICKSVCIKITSCLLLFMLMDIPTAEAQRYSIDKEDDTVEWQQSPAPPADVNDPPAPPTPPGGPAQTPIDGGLGLLLAAGGAYAVRRLRKNEDSPTDLN